VPAWWNFVVFGGDIAVFSLGLAISSQYTVLPLFVHHLTANNVAVALIPAIRALGLYGPQLTVAAAVERRRRALPFILGWTILERVPYLVLALGALWLAGAHDGLLLALFFVMIFAALFGGGVTYPAWLDMIARAIPRHWLGRFMGLWVGLGGLLGIGGAAIAAALLARVAWPLNFALCFALTFAAMVVSYVLLALGREPERIVHAPERAVATHPSLRSRWLAQRQRTRRAADDLWGLVRADVALRRLLVSNALVGIATMANALFAVAALRLGGLGDAGVAAESTVLFVANTAGNFLWGAVGDRFGHRVVLVWSAACIAATALVALGAHGFGPYALVFALLGLNLAGVQLAGFTLIPQYGPEARRPTYVALASVGYAPFVIGAPIVGGLLADARGYAPVFALTALVGVAAAAAFQFWVPDPPRAARAAVGPAT
jgi:MFS family permease